MHKISSIIEFLWNQSMNRNISNIISLLEKDPKAVALDVGCGDGQKTALFKEKIGSNQIIGIDGISDRLSIAKYRGVKIVYADLEKKWLFPNESFDVVVSNQVIEHVIDIDHFIEEIYRILKPGGYCIISTENLSGWHNIGALILGYQDFSHNIIRKSHVGNPFSIHYGKKTAAWSSVGNSGVDDTAFPHMKILTYRSLISSFKAFNFTFIGGKGSGYYPFFGSLGALIAFIDPYHCHFITVKMQKPHRSKK